MKSIYCGIILALFLIGGMASSVYACLVNITVINDGIIHLGSRITGPFFRLSDVHNLGPGESFTYHASGWVASCHGGYSVHVVPERWGYTMEHDCVDSIDLNASGKKDTSWVVTIHKPPVTSNSACGRMTRVKI